MKDVVFIFYYVNVQKDGFMDILESGIDIEEFIDLYYDVIGLEKHNYFVFKGSIIESPASINDMSFSSIDEIPSIYDFLEHDDDKCDKYGELKSKIAEIIGS